MKEMIGGCCVCGDERGWTENPLVYCDGQVCNVAVHQACYGIVTVPTGPWYCRKCESQERSARVRCELCPQREGALKRTDSGNWAHVVCALYIPEVDFGNVTTMEPILLSSVPDERYNKTCCLCMTKGRESKAAVGACMTCNKNGCRQSFHVTCAQQDGLLCEEAGSYNDNVKYTGYCSYHYTKLNKNKDIKTIPPFKPLGSAYSTPEKPADRTSADRTDRTDKTDKSDKLRLEKANKVKPERKNRFCIAEASAALLAQQESAAEARAAEAKAAEARLTEAYAAESKSATVASSSPSGGGGKQDDPSGKFTNANFTETVIGPTGTPPSASAGAEDPSSGDSSLILKFTRNTVTQPGHRGRKSNSQKSDGPGSADGQSTSTSSKLGGSEFSVSYSERVSSPNQAVEDSNSSLKPTKSKKGSSKSNPATPTPTTPMVVTETVMVKDLPPEKSRGTPTVDVETVLSPTRSGPGKATSYTDAYEEFMAKYKSDQEDLPGKRKEKEEEVSPDPPTPTPTPTLTFPSVSKMVTSKPAVHKPSSSKPAISTTSSSGDETSKRERKKHRSGKRKDGKINRPRSTVRSLGGGDGVPSKKRRSSGSSAGSPSGLSMPRLSFSGPGGSGGLSSPLSSSSLPSFLSPAVNHDSAIQDVFNMAGQSGLIGPQSRLTSLHNRQHMEASQSTGMPATMEQLLERQWDQGSEFLMQQATHLDIASLLSCLYQLRQENTRLEEYILSLVQRRDHLLAVNLRLSRPLNQGGSPDNPTSRRSPRFNNVIHSDATTLSASSQDLNSSRSSTQSLNHSLNHSYNQAPALPMSQSHATPAINLNHAQLPLHRSSTPQNNGVAHLPVVPGPGVSQSSAPSARQSPAHSHTSTPVAAAAAAQGAPGHGQATPPPGRLTPGHGPGRMTPSQDRMTPVQVKTTSGQGSSGHGSEVHKRVPSRDSTSTESSHSSRDSTSRDQLGLPGVNPGSHPAMVLQHPQLSSLVQQHLTPEHQHLVYQMMQTQNQAGLGLSVLLPPGIGTATTTTTIMPLNGELPTLTGHSQSQNTSRPKSPRGGDRRQTSSKDKS
ncbi:protein AF-10-like isoform X2 [Acanthaster planci]|uniref:Protein AF-10-like isoform X2 n=1 Tax=Acanthaster planci TaxID=133434 RepID=A0A8B7XGN7_ACAPL|nr:protein AF-10-like isoform X2 [Acanthaster planci]